MSSGCDEVVITLDMVKNFRVTPEFAEEEEEHRRKATKMLVSKRGIDMPAVRDDPADRQHVLQNHLGTKTLLAVVCTWKVAVIYQARILYILKKAGSANITVRFKDQEYERCPSPEDTVDHNPVEDGVLPPSSPSCVAGERDDEEKRGQGDDKHKDEENRKDEANAERVQNGKEEGGKKEKDERRHGEEEKGGAEGAEIREMGEEQKTGDHKADIKKDGEESFIENWERASAAAMALAKVSADVTATIAAFPSPAFSTTEVQEEPFVFLNMDSTLVWDGGDLL